MSLPLRILLRFLLTIALVWAMVTYLDQYIVVTGGWQGIIIVAALIMLMNLVVTPVLQLIVLPLKLLANALAMIIVNGVFLWLTVRIIAMMNPALVTMQIRGGIPGWIVIILALGIGKWLISKMA